MKSHEHAIYSSLYAVRSLDCLDDAGSCSAESKKHDASFSVFEVEVGER